MALLTDDILQATGGKVLFGNEREFSGLSIDSRTIKKGELFVALKGENFDGHNFLNQALAEGSGALVHLPPAAPCAGKTVILVRDTLTALQNIGRHFRLKKNLPVIGVTGTNGKTTTKEFVASILGKDRKVLKTTGNLNNHIGLPLCISRMNGDETAMVLEMGSNAAGDIRLLCEIARPDYAVVTNVGPAHLEGFGSIAAVRDTDLEILDYVNTVSVNADDLFLMEGLKEFRGRIVTYGIRNAADVSAKDITSERGVPRFRLCFPGGRETEVKLGIAGGVNVYNALAAAAIAAEVGAGPEEIKSGLESCKGAPMRFEIREFSGALVINDIYNANPASMEEALRELVRMKRGRTIAVLGDMRELGRYSSDAHSAVVRRVAELGIDVFVAVGPEMTRAASSFAGTCYRVDDAEKAGTVLSDICSDGDTVLVKGSRGMKMERVLASAQGGGVGAL